MKLELLELRRLFAGGDLDVTFGSAGITEFELGSNSPTVAVLPNDQILALTRGDDQHDIGVTRFTSDGEVDTTFGDAGKITFDFDSDDDTGDGGRLIVLLANGGFLVAGSVATDLFDPFGEPQGVQIDPWMRRFNADGSSDNSFGTQGAVKLFVEVRDHNVVVQPDGKILIAGGDRLVRLNANGTRDLSFDEDGIVFLPTVNTGVLTRAIGLQSDGRIVIGGSAGFTRDEALTLFRFNSDGSPDTTFGDDFQVTLNLPGLARDNAVAIHQVAGNKLVVGVDHTATMAAIRLNPNGSLDSSFGNDGISTQSFGAHVKSTMVDLLIDSDGKLILLGQGSQNYGPFYITRLNSNGSRDESFGRIFGGDGVKYQSSAIALQSNGDLIVRAAADPVGAPFDARGQLMRFAAQDATAGPIELAGGTLEITGTGDDDNIQMHGAVTSILASLNGIGSVFDNDDVQQVNVNAGDGDDIVAFEANGQSVNVAGGDGDDRIGAGRGDDTLFGGAGRDRITGGFGNDSIEGGAGRDKLHGAEGNDTLLGGSSGDWLAGGDGADSLVGGGGNDLLNERLGLLDTDRLFGNAGNDILLSPGGGNDQLFGGSGHDRALADGDDAQSSIEELLTDFV